MRLMFFILIFVAFTKVSAQEFIGGQIFNIKTNEPVPWAAILVKGTTKGTISDADGFFKITNSKFPVTLVITCIGYQTREFIVDRPDSSLILHLSLSTTFLAEVVIEAETVKCIQKDSSLMASDIVFYDNFLLLLSHRSGRNLSQLTLLDFNGNIITELSVKNTAQSLYTDCMGNILLLSSDSIWQVYYDYERLQLIYPNTISEFERTLAPCKLFYNGRLYLQYRTFKNIRSIYYVSENGFTRPFYYTSDTASVNYFYEKYDIRYFLQKRRMGENYLYPVRVIKTNIDILRSEIQLDEQDQHYLRPINAPLIINDSAVWIFCYVNNSAVKFNDSCAAIDTTPLILSSMKGWSEEIFRDEITGELYTTTVTGGISTLYKLDKQTLQPIRMLEITDKPFITKMIIRNGYLYFLYIDRKSNVNRMLYRMQID